MLHAHENVHISEQRHLKPFHIMTPFFVGDISAGDGGQISRHQNGSAQNWEHYKRVSHFFHGGLGRQDDKGFFLCIQGSFIGPFSWIQVSFLCLFGLFYGGSSQQDHQGLVIGLFSWIQASCVCLFVHLHFFYSFFFVFFQRGLGRRNDTMFFVDLFSCTRVSFVGLFFLCSLIRVSFVGLFFVHTGLCKSPHMCLLYIYIYIYIYLYYKKNPFLSPLAWRSWTTRSQ